MNCQMMRVISSPSISTTGFATLILAMFVVLLWELEEWSKWFCSHLVVAAEYLPEDVLEDAAVAVVIQLYWCIDAADCFERGGRAIVACGRNSECLSRREFGSNASHRERFAPGKAKTLA